MTDPLPLPAGTLVGGKLRILRLLGAGGMGAVYEVEHEFTKHRRALKLLHPEMAKHPSIVARFLREASAAGRIGNQHIVETFDAGRLDSGEPYLVMEMLDGETLHARLERLGTLPVEEIADLIGQACDGVQAAHEAGIVHRDLKPENMLISQRREGPLVKILDFGISRFDPVVTGAHAVTREGSMLGTPYYMSPEQIEGDKDLDARADIYALGVILYECASGQRPFDAAAMPMLSVLIHQGTPAPLSGLRHDLPPDFIDLISCAMAKNRDDRFATARDLRAALAHFGSSALDVTLDGRDSAVASTRPINVRISDRSPTPISVPPTGPAATPKPIAPSVAGAAVSVAQEKRQGRLGIVLAACVVGGLVAGSVELGIHSGKGSATLGSAAQPLPSSPVVASAPSAPAAPAASLAASAAPPASATPPAAQPAAPPPGQASASPVVAVPLPSAVPGGAVKPVASGTRAAKQGVSPDNPYE